MDREPRWTIRVEGDSIEFALRAGAPWWEWVRTVALVLVALTFCVGLVAAALLNQPGGEGWFDVGAIFSAVAMLAFAAGLGLATLREVRWFAWLLTGRERTVIGPDSVTVHLDAVGFHRVVSRARHPYGEPFAVPTTRWEVRNSLGHRRAKATDVGGLGIMDPLGAWIPFGADLTPAEAEAVLAELALIRRAMGLPDRGPPPPEPDAGGAQPAPPRGKVQRAVDRLARSAGRAVGWAVLRRAPGPRGR